MLNIGNTPYHNRLQTELAEIAQRPFHGVAQMSQLARQYAGTAVYVDALNMSVPLDDGRVATASGSVHGELRGFAYSNDDMMTNKQTANRPKGVARRIAGVVATQGMQPFQTTWKAWRQLFPGRDTELEAEFAVQGVTPVLVPLGKQNIFHQLHPLTGLHLTAENVLARSTLEFDETDIIATIHAITRHRLLTDAPRERPLHGAILGELSTLNALSPHVTKLVQVRAGNIRTPKLGSLGFLETEGTVDGVLRKFVYEAYKPAGGRGYFGAVHAVIYDAPVAVAVSSGRLSPQEAERLPTTARIPIDETFSIHTL